MQLYPIFVTLRACRCLVVGAGSVGRRRILGLLEHEPLELLVVDPALPALPEHPCLRTAQRPFREEDLDGRALVVAATNRPALNARIAVLCQERAVLCNVADAPDTGSFIVPARHSAQGLHLALRTDNAGPAFAARIVREAGLWVTEHYGAATPVMARTRRLLLTEPLPEEEKKRILKRLAASGLPELLARNRLAEARTLLQRLLPRSLHEKIGDLLHDHQ